VIFTCPICSPDGCIRDEEAVSPISEMEKPFEKSDRILAKECKSQSDGSKNEKYVFSGLVMESADCL
jgi:hypothetical protein